MEGVSIPIGYELRLTDDKRIFIWSGCGPFALLYWCDFSKCYRALRGEGVPIMEDTELQTLALKVCAYHRLTTGKETKNGSS